MTTFHKSYNNGVFAVVSEEDAERYSMIKKAGGNPITAAIVRVFTFCSPARYYGRPYEDADPIERMTFTGTYDDLNALMEAGGHQFAPHCGDWDGYVPFSNGLQYGAHGDNYRERELLYVSSLRDVLDVFGLLPTATRPSA